MIIEITPEQQEIIVDALHNRMAFLYKHSQRFKSYGNEEAQKDCLDEMNKAASVLDYIKHPPVEPAGDRYVIQSLQTRQVIGGSALSALELAEQLHDLTNEHGAIVVYTYNIA